MAEDLSYPGLGPVSWGLVREAIDEVQARRRRAIAALNQTRIPYALAGGNAVAAWISKIDKKAVRFTQYVDLLVNRNQLEEVKASLTDAGFVYRHSSGLDLFLDGPDGRARDAVHLLFADEKIRPDHPLPSPAVSEAIEEHGERIVALDALVRLKLNAYRRKDQVHLLDLISVGLLDRTWLTRVAPEHRDRLQTLLDDPDG